MSPERLRSYLIQVACPSAGIGIAIYQVVTQTFEPASLPLILGLILVRYVANGEASS